MSESPDYAHGTMQDSIEFLTAVLNPKKDILKIIDLLIYLFIFFVSVNTA